MKTSTAVWIGLGLLAATLAYTLALYSWLPDQIPIHWNLRGQIDGWGDKRWAAFLMPGVCGLLVAFLIALPAASPRGFRVESFHATFNYLMIVCTALMSFLQVIILQAALHPDRDVSRALFAGILLFFVPMGNVLGRTRRNMWMGIRTPWTMANETVWIATHRLAGRLFVFVGIAGAIALFLNAPRELIMAMFILAVVVPIPYSYYFYHKLDHS